MVAGAGEGGSDRSHAVRRPDLQGLRAVAVLVVVAFHFGIPGVPGGFIGVDIFFVLSGFFITRFLVRELDRTGRLDLTRFWANRIKRLLPNGLLSILATLLASVLLLPSYRLPSISSDAVAASAFFANFHFAAQAIDYFRLDDPPSPLLHYWSLAVEEQFYLVLPLLLTALVLFVRTHRRAGAAALLALIAVASFVASLVVIGHSQPEAFFHPYYRAWPLATGGLVGLAFDRRAVLPGAARFLILGSGVLAIAASVTLLDEAMSYPGLWALAPTLGTAALLLGLGSGGGADMVGRMLAAPPLVWIGDISYSLYLWHWPVAVMLVALWPDAGLRGAVPGIALSFLLASLAYYAVERPIHRRNLPDLRQTRVLAVGGGAVVLTLVIALGTGMVPGRTDPEIAASIAEATADLGPNYHNGCHLEFSDIDQPDCRFGAPDGPRVVLWGDSHAAQWFNALVTAGEQAGFSVETWSKTSCPAPLVGIWYSPSRSVYDACATWREQRLASLLSDPPRLVVLGNSAHYHGWIYDPETDGPADRPREQHLWTEGFQALITRLIAAGIEVVEIRDTPRMYASFRSCLSDGGGAECGRPRAEAMNGMISAETVLPSHRLLDLSDTLCTPTFCPAMRDGAILYRDTHHITASQALSLHPHFITLLSGYSDRSASFHTP